MSRGSSHNPWPRGWLLLSRSSVALGRKPLFSLGHQASLAGPSLGSRHFPQAQAVWPPPWPLQPSDRSCTLCLFLPQGLCLCCSLCPQCSSLRSLHGWHLTCQILAQKSLPGEASLLPLQRPVCAHNLQLLSSLPLLQSGNNPVHSLVYSLISPSPRLHSRAPFEPSPHLSCLGCVPRAWNGARHTVGPQ